MLRPSNNEHELTITSPYGRAWIEHYPKLGENLERLGEIPDWRLWVERAGKPSLSKSPTRLLIKSQLRSWILRKSKRCLATLTFAELTRLVQGLSIPAAPRVYHSRDDSHAHWTEKLACHRAALKEHIFDPQKWHDRAAKGSFIRFINLVRTKECGLTEPYRCCSLATIYGPQHFA